MYGFFDSMEGVAADLIPKLVQLELGLDLMHLMCCTQSGVAI